MPTTRSKTTLVSPSFIPKTRSLSVMPTPADIRRAKDIAAIQNVAQMDVRQLPEGIQKLLAPMLQEFARGHGLAVVPSHKEISTTQAAEMLNVSRPYLIGLIDAGRIPCHHVGVHRRLRLGDVLAYKEMQDADSESALGALQAEAQELNLGY